MECLHSASLSLAGQVHVTVGSSPPNSIWTLYLSSGWLPSHVADTDLPSLDVVMLKRRFCWSTSVLALSQQTHHQAALHASESYAMPSQRIDLDTGIYTAQCSDHSQNMSSVCRAGKCDLGCCTPLNVSCCLPWTMQHSLSIFSDSSDVLQSHRNGRLLGYAITTRAVRHAWVSCLEDIADCLIPGETVYIRWTAVVTTTLSADEECKQEGKWAPRLASMQA